VVDDDWGSWPRQGDHTATGQVHDEHHGGKYGNQGTQSWSKGQEKGQGDWSWSCHKGHEKGGEDQYWFNKGKAREDGNHDDGKGQSAWASSSSSSNRALGSCPGPNYDELGWRQAAGSSETSVVLRLCTIELDQDRLEQLMVKRLEEVLAAIKAVQTTVEAAVTGPAAAAAQTPSQSQPLPSMAPEQGAQVGESEVGESAAGGSAAGESAAGESAAGESAAAAGESAAGDSAASAGGEVSCMASCD